MRFWGVTGTNGKTTTTWIAAAFLNAAPGRRCGYVTTVEVDTGSRRFSTGYTTPPLAQLKEIFAEMESSGCTDCVMEVSSHAIHQHRTGDTVFSGGVFTNLSEDHLDYHKTMEAYFDVKLDFARQIAARRKTTREAENGRVAERVSEAEGDRVAERVSEAERAKPRAPYIVCLDGGYGREMFDAVAKLPLDVIGVTNGTARAGAAPGTRMAGAFDLTGLRLVGDYNKSNVLCAAALAEAAGVPHGVIQAVIPTLTPRWGRLEYVPCAAKASVYVDFAHTPDGLEKVLAAMRPHLRPSASNPRPSLWVVFGAGGDRDPMKRPLMGAACAKLADRLVVTSDNPRSEDPLKIIGAILGGIGEGKRAATVVEPDRKKAIALALREAAAGDIVIVAGKGHETTQEIAGVKYPFDDRETVRGFAP